MCHHHVMHSNGNSLILGDARYPEPWYIRILGPLQPGAV